MTTTTHRTEAFEHELVLHDGMSELVQLMAPFARDGAAVGDEVVVVGEPDFVTALLSATGELPSVHVLAEPHGDRFPARDLHRFQRLLDSRGGSAPPVRVINQMPTMTSDSWPEWRRYEAAVNVVLTRYPAWGTCSYDVRGLAPGMHADLVTSHPQVRTSGGRHPSPEFGDLTAATRTYLDGPAHPVERDEPTLVLPDPSAAEARSAVRDLAVRAGLPPTAQEAVVLAASEAVTNGSVHGEPPVLLRAWADDAGRLTVAVTDAGPGPHPLVGMVPGAPHALSGHGMWIVHLLLRDIHHRRCSNGYTITFAADGETALATPDAGSGSAADRT